MQNVQAQEALQSGLVELANKPAVGVKQAPKTFNFTQTNDGELQSNLSMQPNNFLVEVPKVETSDNENAGKDTYGLFTVNENIHGAQPKAGIDFSKLKENIGFIYEPYHFDLSNTTGRASTLNTYMPSTTSSADLFFSKIGAVQEKEGGMLVKTTSFQPEVYCNRSGQYKFDQDAVTSVDQDIQYVLDNVSKQIQATKAGYKSTVLYKLNTNPLSCSFVDKTISTTTSEVPGSGKVKEIVYKNINDYVLAKLEQAGIPVSLEVPLYIQPGNTAVQNAPDIINANQVYLGSYIRTNLAQSELSCETNKEGVCVDVDGEQFSFQPAGKTAIEGEVEGLLTKYSNIQNVILGDGSNGVRLAYPADCNNFTYSLPGNEVRCQDYMNTITYQNYGYLLANLEVAISDLLKNGKLKTAPMVSINQTYLNWWAPSDYYDVVMGLPTPNTKDAAKYWGLSTYLDGVLAGLSDYFSNYDQAGSFKADNFGMLIKYVYDASDKDESGAQNYVTSMNTLASFMDPKVRAKVEAKGSVLDGTLPPLIHKTSFIVGMPLNSQDSSNVNAAFIKAVGDLQSSLGVSDGMVYLTELFDQPWKGLSPTTDGAPGSLCGAVYPMPFADPDNLKGPPLPAQLPSVCAPNLAKQSPGDPASPSCLCMLNTTNNFSSYYNFVSNTAAPPTDPNDFIQMAPGTLVTYTNGTDHEDPDSFFARFIDGKDGSFSLANMANRYPLQQSCGFDQYDDYNCVEPYTMANGSYNHFLPHSPLHVYPDPRKPLIYPLAQDGKLPVFGDQTPLRLTQGESTYDVPRPPLLDTALPGLRCTGVSDAQTGAASGNAAFDCVEVFFTFPEEKYQPTTVSNKEVPTPDLTARVSFPSCSHDGKGEGSCGIPQYVFTQTADPVKKGDYGVGCKADKPGESLALHNKMIKYVAQGDENTITLHWTAQGSKYKDVSGWQLKTLEAPALKPCEAFDQSQGPSWTFEQAPLVVIPQETTEKDGPNKIDDTYGTVSASYTYKGLPNGIYWFRLQPIGSMRSVDAIDMEYVPIQITGSTVTKQHALENLWHKVAKLTLDYPFAAGDGSAGIPLAYSIKFTRPDGLSYTVVPPVDNGIADISLPAASPALPGTPTTAQIKANTTTVDIQYFNKLKTGQTSCQVKLYSTAGKDAGDPGKFQLVNDDGSLMATTPKDLSKVCYLEVSGGFLNGGTFQFETKQLTAAMQKPI